jgi:FkbM family methyltransferase
VNSRTHRAGDGTIEIAIAGDIVIKVPDDLGCISTGVLLEQEDWFELEAQFVRAAVEPGWNALDIGANYGFYALTIGKVAGPTGRVWAFEPNPSAAALLRASAARNGLANIEVRELALGDTDGRTAFACDAHTELGRVAEIGPGMEVAINRLDTLAAAAPFPPIDFMKIDVEGHERAVLAGARDFLGGHSPLVMIEIVSGADLDLRAVDMLADFGYRSFRLVPGLGALVTLEPDAIDGFTLNAFCAKPDRAARLAEAGRLVERMDAVPETPSRDVFRRFFVQLPPCASQPALADSLLGAPTLAHADYELGLAHHVASRDAKATLASRFAHLRAAHTILRDAFAARPTLPRLLSLARAAKDIGSRSQAVDLIMQPASAAMHRRLDAVVDEPFLPVLERYETMPGTVSAYPWLIGMILESAAVWSAHSSVFSGIHAEFDFHRALRELGVLTPEFARRQQLLLWRAQPDAPLVDPILERPAADHRNAGIWRDHRFAPRKANRTLR